MAPPKNGGRKPKTMNTMKKTKNILLTTATMSTLAIGFTSAAEPYQKEDRSWISLRGNVKLVTPHSFLLDYGEGVITVEMDDFDNDADAYKLVKGDKVMVFGRIDDDMFETTTIEASSVWVDSINTYFYANSADEEDIPFEVSVTTVDSDLKITGTISAIEGREFTLNTGKAGIRIDTAELENNPLDDEGYQKLDVGDRVTVNGEIDNNWWESREIMADYILTLEDKSKKRNRSPDRALK